MAYTPTFTKPYADGWQNLPEEITPITAEALNSYDKAIESTEDQLQKTTELFDNVRSRVAVGMSDRASGYGYRSGIFGSNNNIEANDVLVNGYGNTVSGSGSIYSAVFGSNNQLSGQNSLVVGKNNIVSGSYGITAGAGNQNTKSYSALFGEYLKSVENSYNAHLVCGYYNNPGEYINYGKQILFEIGAGTETERKNVLMVDENGDLKIKGKLIAGGGGTNKTELFTCTPQMQSILNYADNTKYAVGDTLRCYDKSAAVGLEFMDFYIVSVESESVSNNDYPQDAVRKSLNGTAQYGYYVIAPVRTSGGQLKCNGYERVAELCNNYAGLEVGQIILTPPQYQNFFIWNQYQDKSEYTYTTEEEFLNLFSLSGMARIGYYDIMALSSKAGYDHIGAVMPDRNHFFINPQTGGISLRPAGADNLGGVKPDGKTITADEDGTLHANVSGAGSESDMLWYPSVSEDGALSFEKSEMQEAPEPVNIRGPAGKSAYQSAVDSGYTGTEAEWVYSLKGEPGGAYSEEDKAELMAYIDTKFTELTGDILGGAS